MEEETIKPEHEEKPETEPSAVSTDIRDVVVINTEMLILLVFGIYSLLGKNKPSPLSAKEQP